MTRKPITLQSRKFLRDRFDVQARGPSQRVQPAAREVYVIGDEVLNEEESIIARALDDLKLNWSGQVALGGFNELGSSKVDFVLWDYGIALEYQGAFHGNSAGAAQDQRRRQNRRQQGLLTVYLYPTDLERIHDNILRVIGVRGRQQPAVF